MKYRTAELLSATDLEASGTKVIDININDPISRIDFLFKTTKSTHGMSSYTHKNITKIEIVDGSDALFSMDGGQAQALGIYDRKAPTMQHGQHLSACSEFDTYPIDFGRHLWDELLAFDPKRFNNPQLKITYDEDVADTGVSANEAVVVAHCFDEKEIAPIGFLMGKEHWGTTMPADGTYEYVDLPTDYPIRQLLIQGYRSAYEPWDVIEDARLSEDNLKRTIWDWNIERYYRMMKGIWTPVKEQIQGVAANGGGNVFYVTPTDYYTIPELIGVGASDIYINTWGRGGYFAPYTSETTVFFGGMILGYLPNHCIQFPFGNQEDIDDWYDVTQKGSVQLRLESGSSGTNGEGAVVLQQLRRY